MWNLLQNALRMSTKVVVPVVLLLTASPCLADLNEWTWVSGHNEAGEYGRYGTKGVPADSNRPGARMRSISWIDEAGNFWLFGGHEYDSKDNATWLNDLWRYEPDNGDNGTWTWMSGHNAVNENGRYGTKGVPADSNIPGARQRSITWIDESGDLWLFGGWGYASNGDRVYLNDLWRYEPDMGDTGTWTWMSGNDTGDQPGTYGIKGVPADSNIPCARDRSMSWIDESGDFWLFGGYGHDHPGEVDHLNDLWRYEPDRGDNGTWTWMSGHNEKNEKGRYGTKGTPDSANVPGARDTSICWIDESGDLWLFGGGAYDRNGNLGAMNDLWRYEPDMGDNGMWTWMSGDNERFEIGRYGTKGLPADNNIPGARHRSISWIDESGDLWLFGGNGQASTTWGLMNDLWRYEVPECLHDGGCPDGRCLDNICVECVEDDQCFNGLCRENVCVECEINADCDNGLWCDGIETCNETTNMCIEETYPCGADFCNETISECQDCTEDGDCLGGVCLDNICFECRNNTDCSNDEFCDGTETCSAGICAEGNYPCGADFCNDVSDICQECTADADCFGGFCVGNACFDCRNDTDCGNGVCESNICIACVDDSDCNNGLFCDGTETCNAGACEISDIPCASIFCDEVEDICLECTEDDDCFGWFCEENICVECLDETDCGNEFYCDGEETCDAGVCTAGTAPCLDAACDEVIDECVECLRDYDCADMYMCQSALCVPRCELTIKHKALSVEKLKKKAKKVSLSITGDGLFDPTEDIAAAGMQILKPKPNIKKGRLKVKLMIPKGTEPQTIPIQVGECMGEIEIK